jgi:hypothetical protein
MLLTNEIHKIIVPDRVFGVAQIQEYKNLAREKCAGVDG